MAFAEKVWYLGISIQRLCEAESLTWCCYIALSCISQIATLEIITRHTSSAQTFHGIWRVRRSKCIDG